MKPIIFITGVAGFIGSNLADVLLSEGYQVVGVDDLSSGVRDQIPVEVDFIELDIRSAYLEKIIPSGSIIFHLAAKNCISDCHNNPVDAASVNVVGTVNVFQAALEAKAKKIIYAESSALYEGSDCFPTPESEVFPISIYAISKLAGRSFAKTYQNFHKLKTTALRYFCVYGPRQDYRRTVPPVMSAFILKLMQGQQPVIYGTGEKRRDFIHVDDVNVFHIQCLNDPKTDGGTFNLGSGVNYSIRDIYNFVAALLQTDISPRFEPDLIGEAQENLADISRARALGWIPKISLEDGLRRFVDYYRTMNISLNL